MLLTNLFSCFYLISVLRNSPTLDQAADFTTTSPAVQTQLAKDLQDLGIGDHVISNFLSNPQQLKLPIKVQFLGFEEVDGHVKAILSDGYHTMAAKVLETYAFIFKREKIVADQIMNVRNIVMKNGGVCLMSFSITKDVAGKLGNPYPMALA